MDTGMQTLHPMSLVPLVGVDLSMEGLVAAFLAGRNVRTLLAYRNDLEDFRVFTQADTIPEAVALMTSNGPGAANAYALAYRVSLQDRGLSPSTINRRLAALRSLVKVGRLLGVLTWKLEVEGMRTSAYRDTRGPGIDGFRKMLDQLGADLTKRACRDRAILRLLFGMALRRGEVASLDMCHLDLESARLSVLSKGKLERESLSIPPKTLEALTEWVEFRGKDSGALFVALDRAHAGHRLDGSSIYRLVSKLGRSVGLTTRPHGLRHAGITAALDRTNGNTRAVQRFSRHRRLETLSLYDDARQDLAGEIACLVDLGA